MRHFFYEVYYDDQDNMYNTDLLEFVDSHGVGVRVEVWETDDGWHGVKVFHRYDSNGKWIFYFDEEFKNDTQLEEILESLENPEED